MASLLPAADTLEAFRANRRAPLDVWMPAIRAIAARHGLTIEQVQRFERGENPVFELNGKLVLKLVPPFWATIAQREQQCLAHLQSSNVPVAALLGAGGLDGWHYVIEQRVPGIVLEDLWPMLSSAQRHRAAHCVGEVLARLHALPRRTLRPGGIVWPEFARQHIASWSTRADVARLPPRLRETGQTYLESCDVPGAVSGETLLHGDLAPENCLATLTEGEVTIRAIIDFGNAMIGPPLFDLVAPTIVMGKGDRDLVNAILAGYGQPPLTPAMRRELMAYTLLHPMGDWAVCFQLVPTLTSADSWDAVSERLWPR